MGMKTPTQLAETRRLNLKRLIAERYEGSIAAFARAADRNPNLISLVLSTNERIKRTLGERQARLIEKHMSLPEGWLDIERGSSTDERYQTLDIVDVSEIGSNSIEKLTLGAAVFSRHLEAFSSIGAVKCLRASTGEMAPAISAGDLLFVDTSVSKYDKPGVYVITRGDTVFIRRVRPMLTGLVRISADGEEEHIDAKPDEYRPSGRVVGMLRFSQP